ncbi:hypothetical protein ELI54_14750 [Rhizobium ruizarguesonis]|jgi:transposase|nr:hypothetical protein [Rhizobium ruizarguesonis]NKL14777.1 hypothetical protein [Rhizobium leguminosarum bv. viciae]NEJ38831.1 hypothetical protein [Rhizobium ruizarguesonis]QND37851.1 hypothetical protein HB771_22050 [Rhizobium leguminosarum bv. viciae]TAT77532.1 hypothetical protein ELI56_04615 [Rhizobium ruizarguesonis]
MRNELSDSEWTAIKPTLPNKPRGVRRVNDRRVLFAKRSFDVESDDPPHRQKRVITCQYRRLIRQPSHWGRPV